MGETSLIEDCQIARICRFDLVFDHKRLTTLASADAYWRQLKLPSHAGAGLSRDNLMRSRLKAAPTPSNEPFFYRADRSTPISRLRIELQPFFATRSGTRRPVAFLVTIVWGQVPLYSSCKIRSRFARPIFHPPSFPKGGFR